MKKLLIILFLLLPSMYYSDLPDNYISKVIATAISPMVTLFSEDGQRIYIGERGGKVWLGNFNGTDYIIDEDPLIDISDEVDTQGERGFLSMAIEDDESYIYVYFTATRSGIGLPANELDATINKVVKFQLDATKNRTFGRETIVGFHHHLGIPSLAYNHVGGTILISGNTLLISTGDSSNAPFAEQGIIDNIIRPEEDLFQGWRSQLLNSYNGKILRVSKFSGNAVPQNPFFDSSDIEKAEGKIFAMGFRNPFRMEELEDGTLLVADVGASLFEEVTRIQVGTNAGWIYYEGFNFRSEGLTILNPDEGVMFSTLFNDATSFEIHEDDTQRRYVHKVPILQYGHNNEQVVSLANFENEVLTPIENDYNFNGNAITGGKTIKGNNFGEQYNGAYFFCDVYRNWINVAIPSLNENGRYFDRIEQFSADFNNGIVHINQHPDGSLILTDYNDGEIYKITYEGTLGVQEVSFNYNRADKTYFNIYGQNLNLDNKEEIERALQYQSDGIYFIIYTFNNRSKVEKYVKH